jgi:hypothetical protein
MESRLNCYLREVEYFLQDVPYFSKISTDFYNFISKFLLEVSVKPLAKKKKSSHRA